MTDEDRRTLINLMASVGHLMRLDLKREEELKADVGRMARDVGLALEDYHDECKRSRALLTALEDIALCRVPPFSSELIRDPDKVAGAFRDHAKAAIAAYDEIEEPTPAMKAAIVMHDSLLKSK